MGHRLADQLAVSAVAWALLTGTVACGASSSGDGGAAEVGATRSRQLRAAAEDAGLPDEVGDLLARAASAVGATYRVTYEVAGADGTEVVTVTSDPPRRRVDSTAVGSDTSHSFVVAGDGSAVACVRRERSWTCEPADASESAGVFDDAALDATIDRLAASRRTHRFDIEQRRLAGTTATCLVTRPRGAPEGGAAGTLCIAPSGVPLLIERPAGTVRATAYDTAVEASQLASPGR